MEQLIKTLIDTGLNEKEAKIYLTLLELNEAQPSVIARKANVKRPTTYVILKQLQEKGLISYFTKDKCIYFRANKPMKLVEDLLNKYIRLKESLPDLLSLHKKYTSTPQMSIFEGREGLIQIMEDTLTASTELLCWADISLAVYTILEDYYPEYIKKKVKGKKWLRGIFSYDKKALTFKKKGIQELREVYLVPKDKFPFKNEINIYDDKVAIISHQDEIGVIIQNQNIADTQKAIFNLAFEYAKILEKDLLTKEDLAYLNSKED
ncbi:MAG: helix-turn-helix domain-containing protein [Candidatus Gracilibacteria bacterium]